MVWKRLLTRSAGQPALLLLPLGWLSGYHCSAKCRPVTLAVGMLTIAASSPKEEVLIQAARGMREAAERVGTENMGEDVGQESGVRTSAEIIGPVDAPVYKVNDIYRKILYIKHENYDILLKIREQIEKLELPVLLGFDMQ